MRLKPPKFIRWLMPDLIWEMKDRSAVYLTFDDGPTPGVTEWILSTSTAASSTPATASAITPTPTRRDGA